MRKRAVLMHTHEIDELWCSLRLLTAPKSYWSFADLFAICVPVHFKVVSLGLMV